MESYKRFSNRIRKNHQRPDLGRLFCLVSRRLDKSVTISQVELELEELVKGGHLCRVLSKDGTVAYEDPMRLQIMKRNQNDGSSTASSTTTTPRSTQAKPSSTKRSKSQDCGSLPANEAKPTSSASPPASGGRKEKSPSRKGTKAAAAATADPVFAAEADEAKTKESKESKESKEVKESKETKEGKETKETPRSPGGKTRGGKRPRSSSAPGPERTPKSNTSDAPPKVS